MIDDQRDRLHRQARHARDVGLGQRAVEPDRLQDDALVELTHAELIRADGMRRGFARGPLRHRLAPLRAAASAGHRSCVRPRSIKSSLFI